jgi:ABC-type sulfate transport system permease subunit
MNKTFLHALGVLALVFAPLSAFAAETTLKTILQTIADLVAQASPVVASLALIAFFWGLATYLFGFTGKDEDKKKARDLMMYGIIAIFVMVSIFGITVMLQKSFGINKDASVSPPVINNPYTGN